METKLVFWKEVSREKVTPEMISFEKQGDFLLIWNEKTVEIWYEKLVEKAA